MNIFGETGEQAGHQGHQNSSGEQHAGFRPRTLLGETFEGMPLSVQLVSDSAFDHGASAGIYTGQCSLDSSTRPLLVAVKVFGEMLKPVQQEILLRELGIASHVSLRHPRILVFLGTVRVGDQPALVSLLMRNGNLLEYLKSHTGCDKKKLGLQVAEAVNYLHTDVKVVHGDLKCENVLISDSGDALLADFGLSTFVEKSPFDATTMTGIRQMNTVRFAAPELLQGTDDPTGRPRSKTVESDVYAFGMLILQAVTELPPWSNLNAMAVMQKVCQGQHPPRPMSNAFVTISSSWWDVCRSCWSPEPGDRPSMNTVLRRLRDSSLGPYRRLEGNGGPVSSVAYLLGGRNVVSSYLDGSIRAWDSRTGRMVKGLLRVHDGTVYSMAVSPDGLQICSGGRDCTIRRWDAESGAPVGKPMAGHNRNVECVAFSPDGTRIVSCSGDKTVRQWDATTGEALGDPLRGHTSWVYSVAFSPDGTCIASGSSDGTVRLWDRATGANLGVLHHPETEVYSVCFSPDRIHLVCGSPDGAIRIWNISKRQLMHNIKAHSDFVRSVAVSPFGRYIASGSYDTSIRIWDAQTGDPVGDPLTGHTDWIRSIAFSPDGRSLVSGSLDETVRIWDLFE